MPMRASVASVLVAILAGAVWPQHALPVDIGGVEYDSVDPGEPFTAAPLPEQPWTAPEPTGRERRAGMIAYVTSDPGDYKPHRVPRPAERASTLSTFLTPGEDEPVCLGLYALEDIDSLSVDVRTGRAPLAVDVRHEHFWPQRTGWRSRQWYITPELLLPCRDGMKLVPAQRGLLEERPFDVPAGTTAALWLTIAAEADASPGTYWLTVRITSAGDRALILPLKVDVLPFALQRPTDTYSLLYADVARWREMAAAQVLAELRDFVRHGFTGLVEVPLGEADLAGIAEGRATFDASAFARLAGLADDAGMPGPHVCNQGRGPRN